MKLDTTLYSFVTDAAEGTFSLAPFDTVLQPLITETLQELQKDHYRKGTVLIPTLLVWLVLALTLRRDLSYDKVLNWLVSGLRWVAERLPAQNRLVSEGAISHARVNLGVTVFQKLWRKLLPALPALEPDFHEYISVAFDGSTGTMPDTPANQTVFGKPKARGGGTAAFPQARLMSLLAVAARRLIGLAYAAYTGKGTGERALLLEIVQQTVCTGLLFLMDAGLYAFDVLWPLAQRGGAFLIKVPAHVGFHRTQRLADGSWLATLPGKLLNPAAPLSPTGRHRWLKVALTVRVIRVELPGFRPFWLMTNVLDPAISARELALHYHRRWDLEVAYDELKTHQCATLRGQSPTTFRSKLPDLVKQEIYALAIAYTLVRYLMAEAAEAHALDPTQLSFLDTLQHLVDAAPILTAAAPPDRERKYTYLLNLLADCELDRPRRPRLNPRVVKVKMSKFARKRATHLGQTRDMTADLRILEVAEPVLA